MRQEIDIIDTGVQLEPYFECLEHNMNKIKALNDGQYVIEGVDDDVSGIYPTDQRMVLDVEAPPTHYKGRIDMDYVT